MNNNLHTFDTLETLLRKANNETLILINNCSTVSSYKNHCHLCSKFWDYSCTKQPDYTVYTQPNFTCLDYDYGVPGPSFENNYDPDTF